MRLVTKTYRSCVFIEEDGEDRSIIERPSGERYSVPNGSLITVHGDLMSLAVAESELTDENLVDG